MDFNYINDDEQSVIELLKKLNQDHIISLIPKFDSTKRQAFVDQVMRLNQTYPGGLEAYYNRGKKLLRDAKEDVNPYEGFIPSAPKGHKIDFYSPEIDVLEEIGIQEVKNAAFVLVAGGLGERLGYNGIKIGIPIDLITMRSFLEYYCQYILTYQSKYSPHNELPLAIMTSDDTHALTVRLLEEHNNFGMSKTQLTLMKQEKVPALLDIDAHFALKNDELEIDTKPHGHGDVHTLLYQNSLVKQWNNEGRKWVIFFQDTNPLIFRSLPAVLGLSKKNNFEVNSIVVPRKLGEAVGAICTLNKEGEKPLTINVEYNQLDALFKSLGGEKTDNDGFSIFPGNINCLVFSIPEYLVTLDDTQGCIAEFINPKYADATKTVFKTPTRLECMMQDYPKLLASNDRIGVTQIEKRFCFSACKNDITSASIKYKSGLPAECASSCEYDFYRIHQEILKIAGVNFKPSQDKKSFGGIEYQEDAKILLYPSFGVTLKEIRNRFSGINSISAKSTLVLDGNLWINNLNLDGSLWIRSKEEREIKNLNITSNKYVTFEEIDPNEPNLPEYLKIRGYRSLGLENLTLI